jgi:predicted MFS family arabinose efflux permease
MTSSTATGSIIFMPLAAWIAENWGWRMALVPPIAAVMATLHALESPPLPD